MISRTNIDLRGQPKPEGGHDGIRVGVAGPDLQDLGSGEGLRADRGVADRLDVIGTGLFIRLEQLDRRFYESGEVWTGAITGGPASARRPAIVRCRVIGRRVGPSVGVIAGSGSVAAPSLLASSEASTSSATSVPPSSVSGVGWDHAEGLVGHVFRRVLRRTPARGEQGDADEPRRRHPSAPRSPLPLCCLQHV